MLRFPSLGTSGPVDDADYLSALNPGQLEAVQAGPGAWLIIAGAGTGKTRTLTCRVGHLLQSGVAPQRILLCTFTNKAAKEMLDRVERLAAGQASQVWGGTFHHLANRLLRRYAPVLGLDAAYGIMDQDDALELLGACLAVEAESSSARMPQVRPQVLAGLLSLAINRLQPLDELIAQRAPGLLHLSDCLLAAARRYRERKLSMNLLDFDDLLWFLWSLLQEHEAEAESISAGFEHVLVDEYQDSSRIQTCIIDGLARVHGNLTVVGDDAQSIYGFRGADPDNMLSFTSRWPEAQMLKLEENYRSSPQVLKLANASIAHNSSQVPKRLVAHCEPGMRPARIPVQDAQMQAAFVVQRVLELREQEGLALADMAVLYRAHHHCLELQVELTRQAVPYVVRSGLRFFEQAHIKDVLAHLRIVDNPADSLSWLRCLRMQAGIGKRGAERIVELLRIQPEPWSAAMDDDFQRLLPPRSRKGFQELRQVLGSLAGEDFAEHAGRAILEVLDRGYAARLSSLYEDPDSRLEDLQHLAAYAERFAGLRTFLAELNLLSSLSTEDVFKKDKPQDALVLSSIHQAKGLEWSAVFLLWLNEGQVPHSRAAQEIRGLEEERRLFYVALTRARRWLHLLHCQFDERPMRGRSLLKPSRFLEEIPPDLCELWRIELGT